MAGLMLSTGVHFPICCRQYIEKRLLAAGLLLKTAKHLPQFIPALGVPKGSDRQVVTGLQVNMWNNVFSSATATAIAMIEVLQWTECSQRSEMVTSGFKKKSS